MTTGTTDEIVQATAEKYRNWGKWGDDDQLGTLNYITPAKIKEAAGLVKQGKVIAMGTPFDSDGCQTGGIGRFNPIHQMIATGTDAVAGVQLFQGEPLPHGLGYADDTVSMPLQCAAQWDALSHLFHQGRMWNGYSAGEVTAAGAGRNGIQEMKDKIVSRGVFLDVARFKGVDYLEPGYAITEEDLVACAESEGVTIGTGDIVIVRTGQMGYCKKNGWGTYAGGDSPGLSFYTADWLHRTEIAGVATDTWGFEVRPNELEGSFQPLHCVTIPNMGLLVGEILDLEALSEDCAADGVYEFMFVAPPLAITGGVGSPINPQAIK
jgi:kynurenine formamidase